MEQLTDEQSMLVFTKHSKIIVQRSGHDAFLTFPSMDCNQRAAAIEKFIEATLTHMEVSIENKSKYISLWLIHNFGLSPLKTGKFILDSLLELDRPNRMSERIKSMPTTKTPNLEVRMRNR